MVNRDFFDSTDDAQALADELFPDDKIAAALLAEGDVAHITLRYHRGGRIISTAQMPAEYAKNRDEFWRFVNSWLGAVDVD